MDPQSSLVCVWRELGLAREKREGERSLLQCETEHLCDRIVSWEGVVTFFLKPQVWHVFCFIRSVVLVLRSMITVRCCEMAYPCFCR